MTDPAAPTLTLTNDTGSSGTDNITSNAALTLAGDEVGAVVEYSTDDINWSGTLPVAAAGANTVYVRQTDVAGNVGPSSSITFTLDVTDPAAPTLTLTNDTGSSGTDNITSNAALTLAGDEVGAVVEYSTDDINWSGTLPVAAAGANTVYVRQTDVAGNVGPSSSITFTLDVTDPAAPTLTLTNDTGSSGTDNITSNAALTLAGDEVGAVVEYSTDDINWSGTLPVAAAGANTVYVRQTDVAGNVGPSSSITFTLDVTDPAAPTLTLTNDTGSSGTDNITSNAALTLAGDEVGAVVEYSTDDINWSGTLPVAAAGANTVYVRQTDVAGNVGPSSSITFTLDVTDPAAPTLTLTNDTGSSGTDNITSNAALTLAGDEVGAVVEYSTDDINWSGTLPVAAAGANTVYVRQTDVAGNVGPSSSITFTLDVTDPAAPTLTLTNDTGSSGTDNITSNAALTLAGDEVGAVVEYSTDDINWSGTLPVAAAGANTVYVRQTDVAGNVGPSSSITFTLDVTDPAAPTLTLTNDTGSSGTDNITSNAALTLAGDEVGAVVEYSTDDINWSGTLPVAAAGANTVYVRQTDVAGNVGPSSSITFTLDVTDPAAPTLTLTNDTGSSGTDNITSNAALTLAGDEVGAVVEYSTDDINWSGTLPVAAAGANTVYVRQTDVAGNVGPSSSITFTLDVTDPAAPTLTLTNDTGSSGTDNITSNAALTLAGDEVGAVVEYRRTTSTGAGRCR